MTLVSQLEQDRRTRIGYLDEGEMEVWERRCMGMPPGVDKHSGCDGEKTGVNLPTADDLESLWQTDLQSPGYCRAKVSDTPELSQALFNSLISFNTIPVYPCQKVCAWVWTCVMCVCTFLLHFSQFEEQYQTPWSSLAGDHLCIWKNFSMQWKTEQLLI